MEGISLIQRDNTDRQIKAIEEGKGEKQRPKEWREVEKKEARGGGRDTERKDMRREREKEPRNRETERQREK